MTKLNKYIFLLLYKSKCPILKINSFNAHVHYAHICSLFQLPLSNSLMNIQSINNSCSILNNYDVCQILYHFFIFIVSLYPCLPTLIQMLNIGVILYNIGQGSKALEWAVRQQVESSQIKTPFSQLQVYDFFLCSTVSLNSIITIISFY